MSGIFTPRGGFRSIGRRKNEAASGTHIHDGVTSRRLTRDVLKNLLQFDDLTDVFKASGSWNTNASGQITIPHTLGAVPNEVFFQLTGSSRGFIMANDASMTSTTLQFTCYDAGNVVRGAGFAITGYVWAVV